MCGIAGFVAKQGNLLPVNTISKMTDLIRHRGPEDEGFMFITKDNNIIPAGGNMTPDDVWKSQTEYHPITKLNSYHDKFSFMALGHRRLSILDISAAGHQPMSYSNGRYWIVYNGEIYNYKVLNLELIKLGHHFKTINDTETILAAYSEWGVKCMEKFVGMWAFAIFDRDKMELFLARDRYGIKPLYYYFSPDGDFYFASEIKQFTPLYRWQAYINPQRAYDQLVYSFTDHTDETLFAGVFQLPGGTCFKSSIYGINHDASGRIEFKKWYILNKDPFKGSFNEAANIFRSYFERSVNEHLHSEVPIGTALSGGLDSSSIVCVANRILQDSGIIEHQKTFSSCSDYKQFSEKEWMDIVINHTNVDAHFVFPSLEEAIKIVQDIIWYHDEPYQSQSAFLGFKIYTLASNNGVKVLLNGQGPDEYLGGYGQFTTARYATMAKHLKITSLISDITELKKINQSPNSTLILNIISHLLPSSFTMGLKRIKSSSDGVKRIIDINRLKINPVHPFNNNNSKINTLPGISENMTFFSSLPKYLHWEDRNSMAHSIEARVPFLDHRLVEFSYNLPDNFLEKDGVTKRVLREAMSGILPEEVKNRKDKMGFTTPEELWVKQENPTYFRSKVLEAINVADGIIKPGAIKYFDDVVNSRLPFDYTYLRLILFSEWIQKFQVKIK
jgi:asparagine synthase (glutamine-hydrolysing)